MQKSFVFSQETSRSGISARQGMACKRFHFQCAGCTNFDSTPLFFLLNYLLARHCEDFIVDIKKAFPLNSPGAAGDLRASQLEKLKEASQMYENHFLNEMVRAMRATVDRSDMMPVSMTEKIFQDSLDQNYVEKWGAKGGIGLKDFIYNNLKDRYFPEKPKSGFHLQGPLPVSPEGRNFRALEKGTETLIEIQPSRKAVDENGVSKQSSVGSAALEQNSFERKLGEGIVSPWGAQVLHQQTMDSASGALSQVLLLSDSGLMTEFRFSGAAVVEVGQNLSPGQRLGLWDESRALQWRMWPQGSAVT